MKSQTGKVGVRWRNSLGALGLVFSLVLGFGGAAEARSPRDLAQFEQVNAVALSQLPNEAQKTYRLIQQGGPFPYAKDGVVFGNFERILPRKPRGYYHEYTVKTPRSEGGDRSRGARRIVCGGDQTAANECYYSDDHYNSFKRISL